MMNHLRNHNIDLVHEVYYIEDLGLVIDAGLVDHDGIKEYVRVSNYQDQFQMEVNPRGKIINHGGSIKGSEYNDGNVAVLADNWRKVEEFHVEKIKDAGSDTGTYNEFFSSILDTSNNILGKLRTHPKYEEVIKNNSF